MTSSGVPDLRVFPDVAAMSLAAADFLELLASSTVASRGACSLVLSGGQTPAPLYALLAGPRYRETVPWNRVHVFWSDERCVPPDHPESNFRMAFDSLLSRVPLPPAHVHRIRGEEGPDRAAELYEEEIRTFSQGEFPVFDLVLLGVGEDGHTASLFHGSAALRKDERLARPVHLEPPGLNRVTLSLPVLNNAGQVLFLAAGRSKSKVVHEIVEGANPEGLPAGLVRPQRGGLTWMLDREAAGALAGVLNGRIGDR